MSPRAPLEGPPATAAQGDWHHARGCGRAARSPSGGGDGANEGRAHPRDVLGNRVDETPWPRWAFAASVALTVDMMVSEAPRGWTAPAHLPADPGQAEGLFTSRSTACTSSAIRKGRAHCDPAEMPALEAGLAFGAANGPQAVNVLLRAGVAQGRVVA